jgi:hypothetical protein
MEGAEGVGLDVEELRLLLRRRITLRVLSRMFRQIVSSGAGITS